MPASRTGGRPREGRRHRGPLVPLRGRFPLVFTGALAEDRFLSCSLNVVWPNPALPGPPIHGGGGREVLEVPGGCVRDDAIKSHAVSSGSKIEDQQFTGWLSYPDIQRSTDAFARLQKELHARGLAVNKWSRDLIIPHDWR